MARPRFELIGGHLAVDFVNTVEWRSEPDRRQDLLTSFDDLLAWARAAKLVGAAEARALRTAAQRDERGAELALRRARRFREVLARTLARPGGDARHRRRDLRVFNAFLGAALRNRRLEAHGTAWVWSWDRAGGATFDSLLWPIVLAGAELLASAERKQVRECAGEGCGWLFLDTSRNRRRRWCSMQSCGNRAKVRRFYARAREAMDVSDGLPKRSAAGRSSE